MTTAHDAADLEFDFVIIGSGGGSTPAALVMRDHGLRVLIVEKQAKIGGSSAFSGGVIWIPNNDHLNAEGGGDSPERARAYFDAVIGEAGPGSTPARREAYIREGAEMVRYLERKGMKFLHAHWPDYYDTAPGGIAQGRSLCAPLFDINQLGPWADRLASHRVTAMLPISAEESGPFLRAHRSWRGRWLIAKVIARQAINTLFRKRVRGAGNALQGRLFQIALRAGVEIWTETPVSDFLVEDGRVAGVIAQRNGAPVRVRAARGVLVNAGGFARNLEMREAYQPKPTSTQWTQANPGDTGEVIQAALRTGAAVDLMDQAWWLACSFGPDGEMMGMHSPNDVCKPHCIVVGPDGKRFANEANSYMEFGQAMYAAGAIPAWAIFDRRHRARYFFGLLPPGLTPKHLLRKGYLKRADTLEGLAAICGVDPTGLRTTVERFNGFVRQGEDKDFGRGASEYNRYSGDPTAPHANLGSIEKAPFYAIALYPGDVGTSGGLVTDEHARVLRADGSAIPGLYATGNSTASVMGRRYLGAGASVGPSMVFGYIAARHAAGANA
jgi:3-oxosteroid 1-dehydrogenase